MQDALRSMVFVFIGMLALYSFTQDFKKPDLERDKFLIAVKFWLIIGVTLMLLSAFA
ncbi:hypothetical protein [Bacillus mobilis]|uniref:hypothetical protein n=1 Tax=Bacillus mobilis TaxID=2026190 RepID=UPI0015C4E8F8|nr:hypothetical protein [Bacillus mobilis]MCU5594581.1 hypothetical protein [Bacillus mobilis]MCU5738796.1 hypothetical protein [Bacillus mobilis]MCU9559568.1 hypothetical protein [Bacillus mobilis]HDR7517020.1 hypothetical protein [Bacillus mobilis]HDR7549087.1 hypothetical protein [Bacillus mobilis]